MNEFLEVKLCNDNLNIINSGGKGMTIQLSLLESGAYGPQLFAWTLFSRVLFSCYFFMSLSSLVSSVIHTLMVYISHTFSRCI